MKKIALLLGVSLLSMMALSVKAQNVVTAQQEEDNNFANFYEATTNTGRKAVDFAFVREADVAWECVIWRIINFREKFNEFFYYPTKEQADANDAQGRKNLAMTILEAVERGDIQCYESEDFKIPIDYAAMRAKGASIRKDRITIYWTDPETGEETDEVQEEKDTNVAVEISEDNITQIKLKEYWYLNKQDARQNVRIIGLSLMYPKPLRTTADDDEGEAAFQLVDMGWIPMNDPRVRNVLVKQRAYDDYNEVTERSYDDIFITRYFSSYVVRESNRYNRSISDYLTGEDALIASEEIENRIFNLEIDMWEY